MTWISAVLCAVCCVLCAVLCCAVRAQPQKTGEDYAVDNTDWNGLSELVALARSLDVPLEVPTRAFDVGTLQPKDALFIIYPTKELPLPSLDAFMVAGGRLTIADDFGSSDGFLTSYGIQRAPPGLSPYTTDTDTDTAHGADNILGHPELLVAHVQASHPIAEGVDVLVTNHPSSVSHAELHALFAFDSGDPLVLVGSVGKGCLVVVGDASVAINNMMHFDGNRRFLAGLLRYMSNEAKGRNGGQGRVVLVTRDVALVGEFGEPGAHRWHERLRKQLATWAHVEWPDEALRVLSLVAVLLLFLFSVTAFPRSSWYRKSLSLTTPGKAPSLTHTHPHVHVSMFAKARDLRGPMLRYGVELGYLVRRQLDMTPDATDDQVLLSMHHLSTHDFSRQSLDSTEARLYRGLTRRWQRIQSRPNTRVSKRDFLHAVAQGEQLLSNIHVLKRKHHAP